MRKAFEEWLKTPPPENWWEVSEAERIKMTWQAATNAALERAAEVCDRAEVFAWEQWKATGNQHTEGVSDGAYPLTVLRESLTIGS